MSRTTSLPRKQTLRDAKEGAEFIVTAGYGPIVLYAGKILTRDAAKIVTVKTAVPTRWAGTSQRVGERSDFTPREMSDLIKRGLLQFRSDFDPEDGFLNSRPMTPVEQDASDRDDAAWERFTQSETYRCM